MLALTILLITGMFMPVSAETTSFRIMQNGSEMVIVPTGANYLQAPVQKPLYKIESTPARIPYYSSEKTLPKAKNRTRSV